MDLRQMRNNQEQWKLGVSNPLISRNSSIVDFFENRYKTWGDFIYSQFVVAYVVGGVVRHSVSVRRSVCSWRWLFGIASRYVAAKRKSVLGDMQ